MNKAAIKTGLKKLGLNSGDIVLLHSSLASIGHVEGGADAVADAFLEVLGPVGTLVVPTFGALGIITDTVKARPDALSSIHPLASVAAIGKDAEKLCADHWKADIAHSEDTPYARIAEMGGYVCLLGVDQDRNTTLHTVEEMLRAAYLGSTKEETFDTPGGKITKSWDFFPGPHRDFIGLDSALRASGKMTTSRIGNSVVRLIKSQDLIDVCLEIGKRDPAFVLCGNPNCEDCVTQRAALRKNFFAKEDFKLVASAALSGKYVPEIIENLKLSGVGMVELDYLNGKPIQMLESAVVEKAVLELQEADCEVTALSFAAPPADLAPWLKVAGNTCGERVVMPLVGNAASYVKVSAEAEIEISFHNLGIGSEECSRILLELREQGLEAGFTFNAALFARAGEKPFLFSYKQKLRRFIDQLVIADATFDGKSQPLANGNAEIKEMVSILRCASFPGYMLLGASNKCTGSLRDAVARFEQLLREM